MKVLFTVLLTMASTAAFADWQCLARNVRGAAYKGEGKTKIDAQEQALKECAANSVIRCWIQECKETKTEEPNHPPTF